MKKRLLSLYILTFVNMINFTIIIPILPFIIKEYGGTPFIYGLLLSVYPLFQFFAAPILGSLSDHYGRRPILLISQVGTLLSWVIFATAYFVPNINLGLISLPILILLIARIADGITGGNNAVANAYTSDIIPEKERTHVFGVLGGISGIAIILGPVLGGFTMNEALGYLGPVLLSVFISVVALIYMYFFMPESLEKDKRIKKFSFNIGRELQFLPKIKKYAENRIMKYIFFKRVVFLFVFSSFTSIFVLFLVDILSLNSQQIALMFVGIGAMLFFNQIFIASPMARKIGERKALIWGLIFLTFAQILLGFVKDFWYFIPVIYINNLGIALAIPTFKTLLSQHVEDKKQGEIMGLDESLISATSAIAPLVATWLYADFGPVVFIFQGVLMLVVMGVYFKRKGWNSSKS